MMRDAMRQPRLLVFAGPNGAGKSTITPAVSLSAPYINADDIKASTGCTDLEAALQADGLRRECIAGGRSFTFETVLSTDKNLELLETAKARGYFIEGFYALTALPRLHVLRVGCRVQNGGHDVPEEKILSRYDRSLARLPRFIRLCDVCRIYDNSGAEPVCLFKKDGQRYAVSESENWSREQIVALVEQGKRI